MKALKPYVSEIKEKFKDNKDAQNRAVGKLYEDAKQNPVAGCLVSLIQLPIFLGLYRGVNILAKDGKLEEPFLWIPSLEGPVTAPDYRGLDWLFQGWHDVNGMMTPALGWETTLAFLVMPVVLVLGQSLTMSVLAPPIDEGMSQEEKETQEKSQGILKFLPLLIGVFSLQVPAGLTIYWFTSNLFTLTQSLVVKQYYLANPPKIDLPEYWEAIDDLEKMTPEQKRMAASAGLRVVPTLEDMLEGAYCGFSCCCSSGRSQLSFRSFSSVTEAQFHVVVERKPLREESDAWKRITQSTSMEIPEELKDWVETASARNTIASAPKETESRIHKDESEHFFAVRVPAKANTSSS